jgi:multimeric flavodoxin WrbA
VTNVLALFASPKKNGWSSTLHGAFLDGMGDVSIMRIHVYDLAILPCNACGDCRNAFICPLKDDMRKLYALIDACDGMTISTPLYFSAPPSPFKALMDRCQPFWERRRREEISLAKKESFLIAVGGGQYSDMFHPLLRIMRHYFNSCGFRFNEKEWLLVSGSDKKCIDDEIVQTAREAGRLFSQKLGV